jgi:hypothetical protein
VKLSTSQKVGVMKAMTVRQIPAADDRTELVSNHFPAAPRIVEQIKAADKGCWRVRRYDKIAQLLRCGRK